MGPDGTFRIGSIQPGDHTVELRRDQYVAKRFQRAFAAGQTVSLGGADVVLTAAAGTVRIARNPATAAVTYRRSDEGEWREARGNQIDLPAGSYVFSATAPGFAEASKPVQVAGGETREVDFTLVRQQTAVAPPPVVVGNPMADFEDAANWKKTADGWSHKGGGFLPCNLPSKGVFTFTVAPLKTAGRAGQIRWFVQFLDGKNYLLYEIDKKNFWAGVIEKGKKFERIKTAHNIATQQPFTIQIEVAPDHLSQKVRAGATGSNSTTSSRRAAISPRAVRFPDPAEQATGSRSRPVHRTVILAGSIVLVCALAFVSWYSRGRKAQPINPVRLSLGLPEGVNLQWSWHPLEHNALSPDGRTLAFVATNSSVQSALWVRSLDSSEAQQLDQTDGALLPFWSPTPSSSASGPRAS